MWWMVTAIVLVIVLLPIQSAIGEDYFFYRQNILIIILAITLIRYIFLLKHHWISSSKWFKALFIFAPIPIFFFLIGAFSEFQAFSDEKGINTILTKLPYKKQQALATFIRSEIVLFWSAAFLANLFMPFRMLISIWREINKGTH